MKLAKKKLSEEGCAPCQNATAPVKGAELKKLSHKLGSGWKVAKGHHATAPVKGAELKKLSHKLGSGWKVAKGHHLEREYKFKDFREALSFTNAVGKLAERVQHHPDIYLAWGKVKLTIWTHKVGGLTESDFVFAAKVNDLPKGK